MFDPVKMRALADRAAVLQADARVLREDIDALLPLAVSDEAKALIAAWPEADRDCRQRLLHAIIILGTVGSGIGIAIDDLGTAAIGVDL